MSQSTLVIVNPCSQGGGTARRLGYIESRLREVLGPVEVRLTRAPRDAEEIARKAAETGIERLVVAGGDGTASEAASGLLASGRAHAVELGLLPLGTGGDLGRSLGLPRKLDAAIEGLGGGATRRIDAGRVTYCGGDGETAVSHFLNVGSLGLSGLTDLYVKSSPRMFGGGVAFAIAAIRSVLDFRCRAVSIRVDGELVHEGPTNLAAVANGRYFGGGMKIAPDASLSSGIFEVVIVGEMSKAALILKLPTLFTGRHIQDTATTCHRGFLIEADSAADDVLLDIDGEALGRLPASFEILPGAITLFGVARAKV